MQSIWSLHQNAATGILIATLSKHSDLSFSFFLLFSLFFFFLFTFVFLLLFSSWLSFFCFLLSSFSSLFSFLFLFSFLQGLHRLPGPAGRAGRPARRTYIAGDYPRKCRLIAGELLKRCTSYVLRRRLPQSLTRFQLDKLLVRWEAGNTMA